MIGAMAWFLTRLARGMEQGYMDRRRQQGEEVDASTVQAISKLLRAAIIMLIVASLAMGKALVATGMADYLAGGFVSAAGALPTAAILSLFILIMAVLTNIVSNNAAAVIGTPIRNNFV